MRFVTPKTESQQTLSVLHWMRESLVRIDRAEPLIKCTVFYWVYGVSLPRGLAIMKPVWRLTLAEHELPVRLTVLPAFTITSSIWMSKSRQWIKSWHANWPTMIWGSRLLSIPCVGPITASLLAVEMGDGKQYRCSGTCRISGLGTQAIQHRRQGQLTGDQ